MFSYDRGEYDRAEALATEARRLADGLGDVQGAAFAQSSLGFIAYFRGEYDRADALLDEALTLARASGDPVTLARALNNLGVLALARGQLDAVRALFEESLALWRQVRSDGTAALALLFLGRAAHEQGDQQRATTLLEESVALARRTGYARAGGPALVLLGQVMRSLGRHDRATGLFQESLAIRREQGDRRGIAECFEGLAAAAGPDRSRPRRRACWARRTRSGPRSAPRSRRTLSRSGTSSWQDCGSAWARATTASMPKAPACRSTRRSAPRWAATRQRPPDRRRRAERRPAGAADGPGANPSPSVLSPREREVAALVARGLTNRELAAALVVAEGSAANYVKRILGKLGFRSRAQVAAWASRLPPDGLPAEATDS